jgi:hypothetical protein
VAPRLYHLAPFQWRQQYFKLKKEDSDLPIFDFSIIVKATDSFAIRNKLGEGGFGPVYKVILPYSMNKLISRRCLIKYIFQMMVAGYPYRWKRGSHKAQLKDV